jgi:hypothetical protein
MTFLDRLEKRFGHLAVPNVVLVLIVAQVFMYGMILIGRVDYASLLLMPTKVLNGEWWRLLSFVIAPPGVPVSPFGVIFLAFFWYLFWMMSGALESAWGCLNLTSTCCPESFFQLQVVSSVASWLRGRVSRFRRSFFI